MPFRRIEPVGDADGPNLLAGTVLLAATVRSTGDLGDLALISARNTAIGEAALKELTKWRFHPARRKGHPSMWML